MWRPLPSAVAAAHRAAGAAIGGAVTAEGSGHHNTNRLARHVQRHWAAALRWNRRSRVYARNELLRTAKEHAK